MYLLFKKEKKKKKALFNPEKKVSLCIRFFYSASVLQHIKIQPYVHSLPSNFFFFLPPK